MYVTPNIFGVNVKNNRRTIGLSSLENWRGVNLWHNENELSTLENYHAQLTSFCVSFLDSLQFFASSCDFCTSSFLLGCLGLNSCVAVYSGRKVGHRFGVQNAMFRWRFFYSLIS